MCQARVAVETCADKNVRTDLRKNTSRSGLCIDRNDSTKFGKIHQFDNLLKKNSRILGVCRENFQPDVAKLIGTFLHFWFPERPKPNDSHVTIIS